jgi:hypothetical protein
MVFGSFEGQGKRLLKGTQPCRKGATPQYMSSHIHLFCVEISLPAPTI